MALVAVVVYLGSMLWSLRISMSSSRSLPVHDFVGLAQYQRLFANERWLHSLYDLAVYTPLFILACLGLGFLLALLVDRLVSSGALLRAVFLYPYALSFIATGLIWQWMLNPELGIQQAVRGWGFAAFRCDWLIDPDRVIYTLVIATVWQCAGLVMAILLAGLRGIDADILRAARLDGVPAWRIHASIVVPMLRFSFATATLLLLTAAVKLYDAVIAMTQGGPGTASEVPAKFIMDHLFGRANIALASAGATVMVLTAVALLAPLYHARRRALRVDR
ncbi:MAG: carbohydrate ABC transporter permease [Steroidobacteraceae bacterium]